MKKNFIYITTNIINGKQYVGKHYGKEEDGYLGSGNAISNAIIKYGKENFKRKILEFCDPKLNRIYETKYIEQYNTLVPNGYNIHKNGEYGHNEVHSNDTKIKISQTQKQRWKDGKFPIKHTKETKDKISKKNKGKRWNEEQEINYYKSLKLIKLKREIYKPFKPLSTKINKKINTSFKGYFRSLKNKPKSLHDIYPSPLKRKKGYKRKEIALVDKLKIKEFYIIY